MTPANQQSLCLCAQGDACEPQSYARLLGDRRADLLFTDPPYCLLVRRRAGGDPRDPKHRKIDRDPVVRFESVRAYRQFTEAWLPHAVAHVKPSSPLIVWTNFLGREPLLQTAQTLGYGHLWGEFVWAKRTKETAGEQLLRVYEVALVLGRSPIPPSPPKAPAVPWSTVTGYDDEGEGAQWGQHPHHKPFSALEPLLRTYSQPDDLILDPFAGSGSIPAAAVRLKRQVAALELKPEWAERAQARLSLSAG